ncbi:MAG: hypothetical protein JWO85_552 [Candidatus Eremiobacteraeota bacterium]|jgi:hypothetical protein|nr:hypothetical protein [Candidatus Eremiobacteraeota bacterium]
MFLVLALAGTPFVYDGKLAAGRTLAIRDINGSVRVRSGTRLTVRATKTAERGDPNAVAIHVEDTATGLVVCVRYPPNAGDGCSVQPRRGSTDNDTKVDFDVTLPTGVALDAGTVNGSIDARTEGTIDASTVNGRIRATGRDAHTLTTVNGSIELRLLNRPSGSLEAKTVNGPITISLPPGSGVDVQANTLTGEIDAAGLTVARPQYGPGASARGTLGDGAAHLTLSTTNGSIAVRRPS